MGTHSGIAVRTEKGFEVWEKGMDGQMLIDATKEWLVKGPAGERHPNPEHIGTSGYTYYTKIDDPSLDWTSVWEHSQAKSDLEMNWVYFLAIDYVEKQIDLPSPMGYLNDLIEITKAWIDAGWKIAL